MVDLAVSSGVPLSALTILVIPRHEDRTPLDEDACSRDWLLGLANAGACLCLHGFTHRMSEPVRSPWQWAWAHGFARGQGELYLSDAADCERRLEAARAILHRAGLGGEVHGFVPPAWLLSSVAGGVVRQAGFEFHEELRGIFAGDAILARRLIGFGSLNAFEARITSAHAWLQSHRRPEDTRLAIHPADVRRGHAIDSIRCTLRRLLLRLTPMNYMTFLESQHAAPAPS